jgi:hypothetical protein
MTAVMMRISISAVLNRSPESDRLKTGAAEAGPAGDYLAGGGRR